MIKEEVFRVITSVEQEKKIILNTIGFKIF